MTNLKDFKVDNKEFTQQVIEFGRNRKEASKNNHDLPDIPDWIGVSIYKICHGVSMRPNFRGYSYREDMVSDAIEDCVKAVKNYDPDAATRSGKPNAHGYFSQVAYWAMVRRIQLEEKEVNMKIDMIHRSGLDAFVAAGDVETTQICESYLHELRANTSSYEKKKSDAKAKHHGWGSPKKNQKKAAAEKEASKLDE